MMGSIRSVVLAFSLLAIGGTAASAQIFTPTYQAPNTSHDFGVYLADGPGEFAVEGIWRRNFGGYDLGFRAGVADAGDAAALLGLDFRSPIDIGTAPVDVAWTLGVQGVIGDASAVGFQGGLSFGHTFTPDAGFAITPYIHPRLGLINGFGPGDEFDLEVMADLGFDFRLPSGLALRLGFELSDPGADWGIGLAWRR